MTDSWVKRLKAEQRFIREMALSNLKARSAGSLLGMLSYVVAPLLIMAVVDFVFSNIYAIRMQRFPVFIIVGLLPWQFVSSSVFESLNSLIAGRGIMSQFNIRRRDIPLSLVLANFYLYLLGWSVVMVVLILERPALAVLVPVFLIGLILNLIFVFGLSLIFSLINIVLRETGQFVGILLMIWFWVTPIFFSQDMLPVPYRIICYFNPMSSYIEIYRDIFYSARVPDMHLFLFAFLWAVISFCTGNFFFSRLENKLVKLL